MGETPPQSSMPASRRPPKSSLRFGGACTCTSGGRITRASAIASRNSSSGQGRALCIVVPGLARKFCTMTSCTCPYRACASAIGAILADADEDAGGERDRQPAGGVERGQAALGRLVRRAAVALEIGPQRL